MATFNLRSGDLLRLEEIDYVLEKRLGGGVQFRTWLIRGPRRRLVAKLTTAPSKVAKEAAAYEVLKRAGAPTHYFPEVVDVRQHRDFLVHRKGKLLGRLDGLLIRYYPWPTLQEFLFAGASRRSREKVAGKLSRRIKAAHNAGLIHNDLHMKNILVRESKKGYVGVRVIDFGLARMTQNPRALANERRRLSRLLARILR